VIRSGVSGQTFFAPSAGSVAVILAAAATLETAASNHGPIVPIR